MLRILPLLIAFSLASISHAATIPPGESNAKQTLEKSPRHGEWADVKVAGSDAPLRCWVVYPERKEKAPVVIVIHEIFGLTDWIRAVADQLAADGFIAIAPDLLSGLGKDGGGTDSFASRDEVVKAIRALKPQDVMMKLDGVREHATQLPAANGKCATIGFCWSGSMSFGSAAHLAKLDAAVVYYGTGPKDEATYANIKAPVMGFYGGDDARVTSTVKPTEDVMKKLDKKFTAHTYEGAGHGFLRQQDGKDNANQKAANEAWSKTVEFLREALKG